MTGREWLVRAAVPLDPEGAALAHLADDLTVADVVGLGVTTREGAETFAVQRELLELLVERGTRTLAVQDTTEVGDGIDRWVTGGPGAVETVLTQAWGPWRTQEVVDALSWLRERNVHHPDDPVRVMGLTRPTARAGHYDTVLDLTTPQLPAADADRLRVLLGTIRVAHDGGEHVERAHGRYTGAPFVDLARQARDLVAGTRDVEPAALTAMDLITSYHETSLSQGRDPRSQGQESADHIRRRLQESGRPVVIWDGISHLLPVAPALGFHLRTHLGTCYRTVLITMGTGRIRDLTLPPPAADSLEAQLQEVRTTAFTVALGGPGAPPAATTWRRSPTRLRVVSGMYEPEHDEEFYTPLPSLAGHVDHLVHLPVITASHPLGTP